MAQFKKKQKEVVEAFQWEGQNSNEIIEFCDGKYGASDKCYILPGGNILIKTLYGDVTADKGDWLIKDENGDIYLCSPDFFEQTYEEA
jgi:hypothetical protein